MCAKVGDKLISIHHCVTVWTLPRTNLLYTKVCGPCTSPAMYCFYLRKLFCKNTLAQQDIRYCATKFLCFVIWRFRGKSHEIWPASLTVICQMFWRHTGRILSSTLSVDFLFSEIGFQKSLFRLEEFFWRISLQKLPRETEQPAQVDYSAPFAKARSSFGADHGSDLTRPFVALTAPHLLVIPSSLVKLQVKDVPPLGKCHPPPDVSSPREMSPPFHLSLTPQMSPPPPDLSIPYGCHPF